VAVTATHGTSLVASTVRIEGTDLDGQYLFEDVPITATGTSKVLGGKKAFKTITAITSIAGADASTNSYIVGANGTLGLDVKAALSGVVLKEFMDGTQINPPTGLLTAGILDGTADQRGLYTPAAAPNGTHTYEICYITDDPWNS
jgi:hypothetical protein